MITLSKMGWLGAISQLDINSAPTGAPQAFEKLKGKVVAKSISPFFTFLGVRKFTSSYPL
jgi:hypothetical protein